MYTNSFIFWNDNGGCVMWQLETESETREDGDTDTDKTTTTITLLRYVVDVKPKLWLPVRLVEGRLCNNIKINLASIRRYAQKRSSFTLWFNTMRVLLKLLLTTPSRLVSKVFSPFFSCKGTTVSTYVKNNWFASNFQKHGKVKRYHTFALHKILVLYWDWLI